MNGRVNWWILGLGAIVVTGLVYVLGKGFGKDPHAVPFMLTGKKAPEFSLPRVSNNEAVTLSSLKGKPVVINFWSTWCIPCKSEHPVMEWGNEKLGQDVQFVGVVYEDTADNVRAYLERMPSKITQLLDPTGRAAVDFGLAGVPETYFITPDGMIQYKKVGPLVREELAGRIAELLQASGKRGGMQ